MTDCGCDAIGCLAAPQHIGENTVLDALKLGRFDGCCLQGGDDIDDASFKLSRGDVFSGKAPYDKRRAMFTGIEVAGDVTCKA